MSAGKRLLQEILYGEDVHSSTGNAQFKPVGGRHGIMFDPGKPLKAKDIFKADLAGIGLTGKEIFQMFDKRKVKHDIKYGPGYAGGGYAHKIMRDPRMAARKLETKLSIIEEAKKVLSTAAVKAAENIVEKVNEGDYRASTYLLENLMPKASSVQMINNVNAVDFGAFLCSAAQSKTSMHDITNTPIDIDPIEGERIG